jgi:hypothetical protein
MFRFCSFIEWKTGIRKIMSVSELVAKQYTGIFIKSYRYLIDRFHKSWPDKYTDADPFKLIYVDPSDITHHLTFTPRRGWVISRDMNKNSMPFFELPIPKCLKLRYDTGYRWNDPRLKQMFIHALKNDRDGWSYSDQKYKNRCDKIDRVYNSIKKEGYKSQKQLLEEDRTATHMNTNDTVHPILNEVGVSINEDGDFLWSRCGMNRLALAKIIGIESIPVMVYLRHERWQAIRNEICDVAEDKQSLGEIIKFNNNPDLIDISG